jgi:hypothetical protein
MKPVDEPPETAAVLLNPESTDEVGRVGPHALKQAFERGQDLVDAPVRQSRGVEAEHFHVIGAVETMQKLQRIRRQIPFVESRVEMVEVGLQPRGS